MVHNSYAFFRAGHGSALGTDFPYSLVHGDLSPKTACWAGRGPAPTRKIRTLRHTSCTFYPTLRKGIGI